MHAHHTSRANEGQHYHPPGQRGSPAVSVDRPRLVDPRRFDADGFEVDGDREAVAETIARSIRAELIRLGESAAGRAARRLVSTIAARATTRATSTASWLVEVSIGFLAAGAEVGRDAAREALGLLLSCVPHTPVIAPWHAERVGFVLRPIRPGARRGPLRVLPAESIAALRAVDLDLAEQGERVGSLDRGWRRLDAAALVSAGWTRLDDDAAQLRRKCRCPLHDDRDPSLVLLGGASVDAGGARCHGPCGALAWTTDEDGHRWVRRAGGTASQTTPRSVLASDCDPRPAPSLDRAGSIAPWSVVRAPAGVGVVVGREAVDDLVGRHRSHVGVTIAESRGRERVRRRWTRDPLDALAWADRSGPVAERQAIAAEVAVAQERAEARMVLPDRFLSVGRMRATALSLSPIRGAEVTSGGVLSVATPIAFEGVGQRWVLVDVDDLDRNTCSWDRAGVSQRVGALAAADGRLSGRAAVVATSWSGIHVWFELADEVDDPAAWWASEATRSWYDAIGAAVLDALHAGGRVGGFVDPSSRSAGRVARLPGWRLVDGWLRFRAYVVALIDGRGAEPTSSREYLRRRRKVAGAGQASTANG